MILIDKERLFKFIYRVARNSNIPNSELVKFNAWYDDLNFTDVNIDLQSLLAEQDSQNNAIALNSSKVSADGSLDTHSDVNMSNVKLGDLLRYDGANFVPFKPLYACVNSKDYNRPLQSTEALMNQGASFEKYLSLNKEITEDSFYEITTSFIWSHNITTDNFLAKLVVDDDDGNVYEFDFLSMESKDSAGTGQTVNTILNGVIIGNINSGTDARHATQFSTVLMLNQGKTYDISLEWKGESVDDEAVIYKGYLDIEQKIK